MNSTIRSPLAVYINWASYDEISDTVELTEDLALRQLAELLRLRRAGLRLDAYLMDAFWYAKDGGYRTWRTPHWPHGPDRWLNQCLENDVKPGLWLATNRLCRLEPVAAWADSVNPDGTALCCFHGGFLPHLLETMHLWYERGVRLFKFDFADFSAVAASLSRVLLPSEIFTLNITALRAGLAVFRQQHPEVVLLAYNGFVEVTPTAAATGHHPLSDTGQPLLKVVDTRWLEVFDSLYCGDPRPADVPCMSFWRAKDIYSDHMVRYYEWNGVPLPRIDNSAFMIGTTGTRYYRQTAAWQGMFLLSLARGGWVNTYYGNLELLDAQKVAWAKKVQDLFLPLQQAGQITTFGGWPGRSEPYGFAAADGEGALFTVVNPSQTIARLALPSPAVGRVLFRDAGFQPRLEGDAIVLGSEQLALVGTGHYASAQYDLGVQADVHIPGAIQQLSACFEEDGPQAIQTILQPPARGRLRILLRQTEPGGLPKRSRGGMSTKSATLAKLLTLSAWQDGQAVAVEVNYDKAIWSGLSWAVGEIPVERLRPGLPLAIRCATTEVVPVKLAGEVYLVE